MENIQDNGTGVSVQGERINSQRFADDVDLLEISYEKLQENVCGLNIATQPARLKINVDNNGIWGRDNRYGNKVQDECTWWRLG